MKVPTDNVRACRRSKNGDTVRAMSVPRATVVAVVGALALSGCSDNSDTILSLNVEAGEADRGVDQVLVLVEQAGESTFQYTFVPPTALTDIPDPAALPAQGGAGGAPTIQVPLLATPFFKRIKLPESWDTGMATVTVTAFLEGSPTTSDAETAKIRSKESTAVYVDLSGAAPPEGTGEGGAGGAGATANGGATTGGEAATGGEPATGGTATGGTQMTGGTGTGAVPAATGGTGP
jgi:hypothetical protein